MKRLGVLVVAVGAGWIFAGSAWAQQVEVRLTPPTVRFIEPPPLVEVESGVQVVEDNEQEVYVVEGHYWVRHGKHWYRAHDHRGEWREAEPPPLLVRLPAGKYKHWKGHHKEKWKEKKEKKHRK